MMFRLLSLLFLSFFLAENASAAITLRGIDNSRYSTAHGKNLGQSNETTNNFYGGLSGTCDSGASSTSTCDSCASSSGACNTRRIHNDLLFSISLSSDVQGYPLVTTDLGSDSGQTLVTFTSSPAKNVLVPAGTIITYNIRWEEICTNVFNLTDCSVTALNNIRQGRLRIGVDAFQNANSRLDEGEYYTDIQIHLAVLSADDETICHQDDSSINPTGACNFIAYPGDGKVFIETVRASCSFPSVGDSEAQSLRVFYQEASKGFPDRSSGQTEDLVLGTENEACSNSTSIVDLNKNEITGLTNGTSYAFSLALVDEANNVGSFLIPTNTDPADSSDCFSDELDQWPQNCHIAQPAKVISLLSDEFDCFITTAAYGSPFRPKVEDFRKFRNFFLKTNDFGRWVINTYYRLSPPIAHWIQNHPMVKPFVRLLLWPLWLFAWVSLNLGLISALAMSVIFVLLGVQVTRRMRRAGVRR